MSIVGFGGVGKTRLALQVGAELRSAYADGVWWCELAGVRDPDAVPEAVAVALEYAPSLGVSTAEGLAGFFRHKHLLLVLDNCEHLLAAVGGFVRAMGEEAPQLSVLATSREALGIRGERAYLLPALELPVDASPFSVEMSEAGALFTTRARERGRLVARHRGERDRHRRVVRESRRQRARDRTGGGAHDRDVALGDPGSARPAVPAVEEPRRRRGGAPPFAAGGDRVVPCAARAGRAGAAAVALGIRRGFRPGGGDRDRGRRRSRGVRRRRSDWSHSSRRSLVERNETDGVSRYRLLETIRQFAAERLAAEGNTERARDAHAAHYLATSREHFAMLSTSSDFEALELRPRRHPEPCHGLALADRIRPGRRRPRVLRRCRVGRQRQRAVRVGRRARPRRRRGAAPPRSRPDPRLRLRVVLLGPAAPSISATETGISTWSLPRTRPTPIRC